MDAQARAASEARARIRKEFPIEATVTGVHVPVRLEPDPESRAVGWVRSGSSIRLRRESIAHPRCRTGYHAVHPRGFLCAGQGIELDRPPEESEIAERAADAPLPYRYYFVKEANAPEYHRLPSRGEQRAVDEALFTVRDVPTPERRPERRMEKSRPELPAVVHRLLDRRFFVAGVDVVSRHDRNFVRTVRGSYVPLARLAAREGPEFRGVELDASRTLPVAFALRAAVPQRVRERNGELLLVDDVDAEPIPRHAVLEGWRRRTHVGNRAVHELEGERYLKPWFVGVAEKIAPPFRPEDDEPWVHVDLSEKTLVLYRGEHPVFATLVSTGTEAHATPTGVFTIHRKMITDTMSNLGPEAGDDRYRIEDVPWTQYFAGSIALHGAFWHSQFGLPRSHGCVNLSPHDARRIFRETWPSVPEGFHGVSSDRTGFPASRVVVTE